MPVCGRARGTPLSKAEMAAVTAHSKDRLHVQQQHTQGTKAKEGDPKCLFHWKKGLCTGGRGEGLARCTPVLSHSTRRSNPAASNSAFAAMAHSPSSEFRHLSLLPFLLHDWWGDSGESCVQGPGICGDPGTSVNFEYTKGKTLTRSSAPSSPLKPKQDW